MTGDYLVPIKMTFSAEDAKEKSPLLPDVMYDTNGTITERGPLEMTQIGRSPSPSVTYFFVSCVDGLEFEVIYL